MNKYYDKKIETLDANSLKKLQTAKILSMLNYVKKYSPLYSKMYKNIDLNEIKSLKDFETLPFTTKQDLVKCYPFGSLCVSKRSVSEVHFSSGTSNKPIPTYLTERDLKLSNKALARTWYMQGVRKGTVFGMLASYGLFSAGLLNHYAIQKIGAFVMPISSSSTDKTINLLIEYKVEEIAAVASYYLYLINKIKESRLNKNSFNLKIAIAGGEPFTDSQRKYIEENLGVKLLDQ